MFMMLTRPLSAKSLPQMSKIAFSFCNFISKVASAKFMNCKMKKTEHVFIFEVSLVK